MIASDHVLGWLGLPGGSEWIVIGLVAVVIFGKRLPDVGRSLGRGIVEFKKGLQGVKDEIDGADSPDRPPVPTTTSTDEQAAKDV